MLKKKIVWVQYTINVPPQKPETKKLNDEIWGIFFFLLFFADFFSEKQKKGVEAAFFGYSGYWLLAREGKG